MVGFQRFYNRINSSQDLTRDLAVTSGRETNPFDDYGIERPIAPIVHLTLGHQQLKPMLRLQPRLRAVSE